MEWNAKYILAPTVVIHIGFFEMNNGGPVIEVVLLQRYSIGILL